MANVHGDGGPRHVAVTMIHSGDRLLLIYNTRWRAFSFPMTKLRAWEVLPRPWDEIDRSQQDALWVDAAAHAAVECLGGSNCPIPALDGTVEVEYTDVEQSGRDGAERIYHYKVFKLDVERQFESLVQPYQWLTVEDIRGGMHRPISPTVLKILGNEDVNRLVESWVE